MKAHKVNNIISFSDKQQYKQQQTSGKRKAQQNQVIAPF